jgi:hypothetical protein
MESHLFIALAVLSQSSIAHTELKPEPKHFLQQFTQIMHQPNSKLAALYNDSASIERKIDDLDKQKITGKQYKLWLNTATAHDLLRLHSDFSNVDFYTNGSRIAIKATRYFKSLCFSDAHYFIVIDKNSDGNYNIIKEHTQQPKQSLCKSASNHEKSLKISFNQAAERFAKTQPLSLKQEILAIAESLKEKLPLALDKNTQLTDFSYSDKEIHYHYAIQQYRSSVKYNAMLESIIKPNAIRQFCMQDTQQKMLLKGGRSLHSYHDKNGENIFSFQVSAQQCSNNL